MPDPRYEIKINVKSKSVLSFMAMRFFVRANILFVITQSQSELLR